MTIVIRYNPARGFEDTALALARRLFAQFDEAIDSLSLIPVTDEDLDLHLDGHLLHSTTQSGTLPRVAQVTAALLDRTPPSPPCCCVLP